jgi:NAD(P)-dependent dehydrogenase (short-subunit alcohol dehydrogenase family)
VGASTGIGRATASRLHGLGAQVIVSARSRPKRWTPLWPTSTPAATAMPLDATDRRHARRAAHMLARHGRIDLALYCAGHYHAMRATDFDLDDALRHQQVNYGGRAEHLLDAVLPTLLRAAAPARPGHTSAWWPAWPATAACRNALAYGPTKAALINLAEVLYLDLHAAGHGRVAHQPRLRRDAADGAEQLQDAGADHARRGRAAIVRGWEAGEFEIHFPKRFTLWLKAMRPAARRHAYFAAMRRATGL